MPGFKTHRWIGMISAILFSLVFLFLIYEKIPLTGWKLLLIPPILFIYSQIPDLDSPVSRIKKRFMQAVFVLMILSAVISVFIHPYLMFALLAAIGIFGLYLYRVKHRGPLHSFSFIVLMSLPLVFVHWFLAVLAFVCATSHLLADWSFSALKRGIKRLFGIKNHYEVNIHF